MKYFTSQFDFFFFKEKLMTCSNIADDENFTVFSLIKTITFLASQKN